MRLKNLFFPLMLAVSIAVVVIYGWPAFSKISGVNTDRIEKGKRLEDLTKKGDNVELLNSRLEKGGEDITLVYAYLPQKQTEERIIDVINYVALGTPGVVLSELGIEKKTAATVDTASASSTAGAATSASTKSDGGLVFVTAKVGIVGGYADIKSFLNRIDAVDMYNLTKDVKISSMEKAGAKAEEGLVPTNDPDLLKAEITIDFGWAPAATLKDKIDSDVLERGSFDFAVLRKLRDAMQVKVPEISTGGAGNKENPFKL